MEWLMPLLKAAQTRIYHYAHHLGRQPTAAALWLAHQFFMMQDLTQRFKS